MSQAALLCGGRAVEAAVPTPHVGVLLPQGAGTGHSELQVQGPQASGP